jgi:DNA-binding FrmR family transcriptional regulator
MTTTTVKVKKPRNGSTVEPANGDRIDLRLARIEGQVIGIRKMARDRRSCIDILTQLSAIQSALDQVKIEFLTHHLEECPLGEGCLSETMIEGMSKDDQHNEMKTALNRFVK